MSNEHKIIDDELELVEEIIKELGHKNSIAAERRRTAANKKNIAIMNAIIPHILSEAHSLKSDYPNVDITSDDESKKYLYHDSTSSIRVMDCNREIVRFTVHNNSDDAELAILTMRVDHDGKYKERRIDIDISSGTIDVIISHIISKKIMNRMFFMVREHIQVMTKTPIRYVTIILMDKNNGDERTIECKLEDLDQIMTDIVSDGDFLIISFIGR